MGRSIAVWAVAVLFLLAVPAAKADPPIVTLVGSLQEELGCPGDWQPECPDTRLTQQGDVYTGTFDVPAGSYEYKVALDNSWDVNYGAGGQPGGANIPVTAPGGPVTFTYDPATHVISDDVPRPLQAERGAHWLRRDVIAWQPPAEAQSFRLHFAPDGGLRIEDGQITGGDSVALAPEPLPPELATQFPHLAHYQGFHVPRQARDHLTGELVVGAYDAHGHLLTSTGLQIPGVLDDLYADAARADLGPAWRHGRPSLAVWAPTAKDVTLQLRDEQLAMHRGRDGVWRIEGRRGWRDAPYAFAVKVYVPTLDQVVTNVVTDPYSVALTTNSQRSVLADLDDPALIPRGWHHLRKPHVAKPEATTIYELHIRDFSITDETVPPEHRGTYLAFTDRHSAGMRHLRELAHAGMNTLHLLPANDIATIEEDRAEQQEPACDLPAFPPDSEQQQACTTAVAARDGFNWGYDPLHYTAPEGSYATDPDGPRRTLEFRRMVEGINRAGLRVVMDVVYNHTPAAGQDPKSVLDRIVPGYYQRLDPTSGAVENSTCCANTATEHRMMGKLLVDSVLTWAREYKVDGFRFDLMGHQPKALMVELKRRLERQVGHPVYLYGEGWNFGEVMDDARFVQATQANMAGTGIGTFSDRLRDAVRGGGPFDADPRVQGFASGLFTDPNASPANGTPEQQRTRLLHYQDLIRLGLAGNLRDYTFTDASGATVKGSQVDYNGQPAGYAGDPSETITYVDAHDNETLFDALTYKLPAATSMADRVRMQTLALATTVLGQSPSFWLAGSDLLRSKSLDRNSFDSGDWFNRIDWTGRESTFGSGLPPATDNQAKWDYMRPLLGDPALRPRAADIRAAGERARELLRIRSSSRLFRLGSLRAIQEHLTFPDAGPGQTPGVIVMRIRDRHEGIAVVFNASPGTTTQAIPGRWRLHPVQAHGSDPVVRQSRAHDGELTVPARTVAVFTAR
jgi:pullulanase-type alpha-1,6-glucosidase